jgi:uncharacterized protein (TIGR02284 family)
MTTTTTEATSTLNSLLRGEMAALQTYGQVFEKLKDSDAPGVEAFHQLRRDHRDAAEALQRFVQVKGDEPSRDSGPWGAFAKTVTGTAKLFGNTAALKALKEGEEHGVKEYQDALDDQSLPSEARSLIRDTLLPRQRQHVQTIDRLMNAQ